MENFIVRPRAEEFSLIEQKWLLTLSDQLTEVMRHNIAFTRIAFISLYGSQNYNLAGPQSDIDSECFIFPSMEDLCFGKTPTSFKIHTDNGDIYVKDIRLMFDELRKCSPNILELLASDYMWVNTEYQYYLLALFVNVNKFAKLSTYKLLKGLEGLFRRYSNPTAICSKYIVNAIRLNQMIERIIAGEDYKNTLIPANATGLFNLKYKELHPDDGQRLYTLTEETLDMLKEYYDSHELTFQPRIKEMINDYQKDLLIKYIHSI